MLYAPSTNGFYTAEIHGINIPADAVEITEQLHADLLAAQSEGKRIQADVNGAPVAIADVPSFDSLKAAQFADFNADRTKYLDALTGIAGRAARSGDTATALVCDGVAEGLLVLKDQPEVLAATDLPGLQQAMLYHYALLLVNVPVNVKAVFDQAKA